VRHHHPVVWPTARGRAPAGPVVRPTGCGAPLRGLVYALVLVQTLAGSFSAAGAGDIAVLMAADVDAYREALEGFKAGLKNHRIVAELNMDGDVSRGGRLMADIRAKTNPDLVFAVGVWALQAAVEKPGPFPVVYAMVLNPPSVVPPSVRNVTGASMNVPVEQTIRIVKQLGPQVRRIGVVYDPNKTGYLVKRADAVAREEGVQIVAREARSSKEAVAALDALQAEGIDVLWILPDESNLAEPMLQHMLLVSYRKKIPLVGLSENHAQRGGLLSLSFASSGDIGRQAAELANSILAGKPPAEVPFTSARQVNLTVNLKAAQKLGLTVPPGLLALANNVIR
jgi:putative ABC transport system substrate-binding protein